MSSFKLNVGIIAFLLVLTGLLYAVMFAMDPSTTKISAIANPDVLNAEYAKRLPKVLITYAHGEEVYFKNCNALVASAADKGFDQIHSYKRGHIDPVFYEKNKSILEQKRGAGYWLWKPYFILKTMQNMPEGALLFYADSGVVFTKPIDELLRLMDEHNMVLVGHGKPAPLVRHLKRESYQYFSPEPSKDVLQAQNIWGFFMVLKNNAHTRQIVERWLNVAQIAEAITDAPFDAKIQSTEFHYHQHDQSLFSVIVAQEGSGIKIIPRNVMREQYGIKNFHRHPNEEDKSPLWIQSGAPTFISDLLWNNYLMQWLRHSF